MTLQNGRSAASGRHEAGIATNDARNVPRVIKRKVIGERNEYARSRAKSARLNPGKVGDEWRVMDKSSSERVLVVESDDALRCSIVGALSDAGYEVSTDYRE
jgi:hypothetical protein